VVTKKPSQLPAIGGSKVKDLGNRLVAKKNREPRNGNGSVIRSRFSCPTLSSDYKKQTTRRDLEVEVDNEIGWWIKKPY